MHDYGHRYRKAILALDLSVTDNIPARWMDMNGLPPSPPKPKPVIRSKKKNA